LRPRRDKVAIRSRADNDKDRGAWRSAPGRVSEVGREFQVVALAKPEDLVGNFDFNVAGNDEESFFSPVTYFPGDTGAGGKFDGENLHIVWLVRAAQKRVTVTTIFCGEVTRLSIPDADQMYGVLIDVFSKQKGNRRAERLC
jgi:hypothetical protein